MPVCVAVCRGVSKVGAHYDKLRQDVAQQKQALHTGHLEFLPLKKANKPQSFGLCIKACTYGCMSASCLCADF